MSYPAAVLYIELPRETRTTLYDHCSSIYPEGLLPRGCFSRFAENSREPEKMRWVLLSSGIVLHEVAALINLIES